jgi:hypothetical protein
VALPPIFGTLFRPKVGFHFRPFIIVDRPAEQRWGPLLVALTPRLQRTGVATVTRMADLMQALAADRHATPLLRLTAAALVRDDRHGDSHGLPRVSSR